MNSSSIGLNKIKIGLNGNVCNVIIERKSISGGIIAIPRERRSKALRSPFKEINGGSDVRVRSLHANAMCTNAYT